MFAMQAHRRKRGQSGRPKIQDDQLRLRTIGVRVNVLELDELQRKADSVGLPLSQWLRQIALGRAVIRPLVPEVNRQAYAELAKLAGNLNQLVKLLNEGRPLPSLVTLHHMLQQLDRRIDALRLELIGVPHDSQTD